MAKYTPPKVSGEFVRGEQGKAQVRIKNKTTFVRFDKTGNVHKFKRTRDIAKLKPGVWFIRLSGDETEIYSFQPFSGNCVGKIESFVAKEGEEPRPRVKDYEGRDGKKGYSVTSFTVLVEIVEPEKYAGITIPWNLRYNFREAKDGDKSVVGLPDRGRHSKTLEEFCDITGVWKQGPMEYSDNVLVEVEKRILRQDRQFNFIIKNGWIDTIYEAEEPVDEDDWEEESAEEAVKESDDELSWDEE